MRNRTQRILSLVLALVMVFGFVVPAYAQTGVLPEPKDTYTFNVDVTLNGLGGLVDGEVDVYLRGITPNGDWKVFDWQQVIEIENGEGTAEIELPATLDDVDGTEYDVADLSDLELWFGLYDIDEPVDVDFYDYDDWWNYGDVFPEYLDKYDDEIYWTKYAIADLDFDTDVNFTFPVTFKYPEISEDDFTFYVVDENGKGIQDARIYLHKVLRDSNGDYLLDKNEDYQVDEDADRSRIGYTDTRGMLIINADDKNALAAWLGTEADATEIVGGVRAEYEDWNSSTTFVNFARENNKAVVVMTPQDTTFKVTVGTRDFDFPFRSLEGAKVQIVENVGELWGKPAQGAVLAEGYTNAKGEIVFTNVDLTNSVYYNIPDDIDEFDEPIIMEMLRENWDELIIKEMLRKNWLVVEKDGYTSVERLLTDDEIENEEARVILLATDIDLSRFVDRIDGDDRYETAVAVARKSLDEFNNEYPENVILATGEDFADALSANGLTKVFDAPILLTRKAGLPDATAEYLREIVEANGGKVNVVIVGGENAVSPEVQADLQYNYSATVSRMAGEDRYETAAQIANFLTTQGMKGDGNWNGSALVANGEGFADAIIASLPAAKYGLPILLTRQEALRAVTQETIQDPTQGYKEITVVGGPNVVSELAMSQIRAPKVDRLWGENRYLTSLEALRMFPDATKLYVVSALEYTDALVAAKLAADNNAAILLVNPNEVRAEVVDYLLGSKITDITIIGGTNAISDDVKTELAQILLLKK